MQRFDHSGLGEIITHWFITVANKDTFPLLAFFSSALINFAIPSGGGHWVVQGPFIMKAVKQLGANIGHAVMAIAGLGARDIMGYCNTTLHQCNFYLRSNANLSC